MRSRRMFSELSGNVLRTVLEYICKIICFAKEFIILIMQVSQDASDMSRPSNKRRRTYGPYRSLPRNKYRGVSRRYRNSVGTGVRTYVRSAIKRALEAKKAEVITAAIPFNPVIAAADVYSLIPGIIQGTGQASRIGNSVKLKKLVIRGMVNCFSQGSTVSPTYVDVYIFKSKLANSPSPITMVDFLQLGSSSTGYDGNTVPYSGLLTVNEDKYRKCIHKRFHLFNPQNTLNIAFASALNPSETFVWDLTKFAKSNLLFDDSTSTVVNDNLYIAIGSTQSNAATVGAVNTGEITYVVETEYYDA